MDKWATTMSIRADVASWWLFVFWLTSVRMVPEEPFSFLPTARRDRAVSISIRAGVGVCIPLAGSVDSSGCASRSVVG